MTRRALAAVFAVVIAFYLLLIAAMWSIGVYVCSLPPGIVTAGVALWVAAGWIKVIIQDNMGRL